MAVSYDSSISKLLHPISTQLPKPVRAHGSSFAFAAISSHFKVQASTSSYPPSNKDDIPQLRRRNTRKAGLRGGPRRLIRISTSDGRWHGEWSCDYVFSLRELQLMDLAEDGQKDEKVFVTLTIQKHASFGFSINGRVIASFNRKCSCCFSSYCKEIDTTFDVWVLPSSKSNEPQLPENGGSDPSVIYVKPGSEADLDSLVQDTIRLTASAKETCSESCEKPAIIWQFTDGKRTYDGRWSRLLEIKNAMQGTSQSS